MTRAADPRPDKGATRSRITWGCDVTPIPASEIPVCLSFTWCSSCRCRGGRGRGADPVRPAARVVAGTTLAGSRAPRCRTPGAPAAGAAAAEPLHALAIVAGAMVGAGAVWVGGLLAWRWRRPWLDAARTAPPRPLPRRRWCGPPRRSRKSGKHPSYPLRPGVNCPVTFICTFLASAPKTSQRSSATRRRAGEPGGRPARSCRQTREPGSTMTLPPRATRGRATGASS